MNAGGAALVAVDGVNGAAVKAAARARLAAADRHLRGGISVWDASGVFEELAVAGDKAGRPSARTLLLLYAADLAFRLRWEIRPALAEGRIVVAAPYVDTAIAFGRAVGLTAAWLTDLFRFAPRADEYAYSDSGPARQVAKRDGFVEFGCDRIAALPNGVTRHQVLEHARSHLEIAARRKKRSKGAA